MKPTTLMLAAGLCLTPLATYAFDDKHNKTDKVAHAQDQMSKKDKQTEMKSDKTLDSKTANKDTKTKKRKKAKMDPNMDMKK